MTILGKILVFVNLLFSLAVAGLMVVVFMTRTNWKAGYDDAVKKLEVARATLAAEKAAGVEVARAKDEAVQKAVAEARDARGKLDTALAEVKAKEAELVKANSLRTDETTTKTQVTAELDRIRNERAAIEKQRADLEKRLQDAVTASVTSRNEAVASEIRFRSEHERVLKLLEQVEAMSRDIARLKSSGGGSLGGTESTVANRSPAPEGVRGTVVNTDPQSGLATISAGSDAGLTRNMVLQVFRLSPSPTYLGTLQVLNTRPLEAVGRYTPSQKRIPIQPGDEVATTVLSTGGPAGGGR